MKVRALRALLETERLIANYGSYLGIGSAFIHDLIRIDVEPLKLSYSQARTDRQVPDDPELLLIWDILDQLVRSREILPYLLEDDVVTPSLPVFWADKGIIRESATEFVAWPNVTREGYLLYDNTHFSTREQAIRRGIKEAASAIESWTETVAERVAKAQDAQRILSERQAHLESYRALANALPPSVQATT